MFIWQHLNDAHCRIHIHVLSRCVSLLPEDEKHHFPLRVKVLRLLFIRNSSGRRCAPPSLVEDNLQGCLSHGLTWHTKQVFLMFKDCSYLLTRCSGNPEEGPLSGKQQDARELEHSEVTSSWGHKIYLEKSEGPVSKYSRHPLII